MRTQYIYCNNNSIMLLCYLLKKYKINNILIIKNNYKKDLNFIMMYIHNTLNCINKMGLIFFKF